MTAQKNIAYRMLAISLAALALWDVALPLWNGTAPEDDLWNLYSVFAIISAWGFPLLLAGMGCRYLTEDKTYAAGYLLKKRLPRALVGCIVWWLISALTLMKYSHPDETDTDTFFESMATVLQAPYFVKFLQLVVVFFAFYPLLKRIADDQKLTGYAVAVFAVMSVVVPILRYIPYLKYIYLFATQINWSFFTEFGLYLFLGIYLSRKTFLWHHRVVIYCAGILSSVAMYACTTLAYSQENGMDSSFINEASPFTVLQTAAVIVLILSLSRKAKEGKRSRIRKHIAHCAYTYVPLCAIFISLSDRLFSLEALPTAIVLPIKALFAMLCALALSAVFRRIPLLSYFSK